MEITVWQVKFKTQKTLFYDLMAGKRKLIMIIGGASALVLIIATAVLFFLMNGEEADEIKEGTESVSEVKESETETELPEPEVPIYLKLKPFTTTIGQEPRYAKISMYFKMGSPEPSAFLGLRLAEVKDSVIAVLQKTDSKEVKQDGWVERLKERIIIRVSSLFPKEPEWEDSKPIRSVLFHELLIQ